MTTFQLLLIMDDLPDSRPWEPKPFAVAVLDGDAFLCDALCTQLRARGFATSGFYDVSSFMQAERDMAYDAYVLDAMADWPRNDNLLRAVVHGVKARGDAPIFILGNHIAPERVDGLGTILMEYKVRYQLRPIPVDYLARQVAEAVAKVAGI